MRQVAICKCKKSKRVTAKKGTGAFPEDVVVVFYADGQEDELAEVCARELVKYDLPLSALVNGGLYSSVANSVIEWQSFERRVRGAMMRRKESAVSKIANTSEADTDTDGSGAEDGSDGENINGDDEGEKS